MKEAPGFSLKYFLALGRNRFTENVKTPYTLARHAMKTKGFLCILNQNMDKS